MTILYEDKYLVMAVKPVGVLSEDDPKAACMPALLREHYRTQGEKDLLWALSSYEANKKAPPVPWGKTVKSTKRKKISRPI